MNLSLYYMTSHYPYIIIPHLSWPLHNYTLPFYDLYIFNISRPLTLLYLTCHDPHIIIHYRSWPLHYHIYHTCHDPMSLIKISSPDTGIVSGVTFWSCHTMVLSTMALHKKSVSYIILLVTPFNQYKVRNHENLYRGKRTEDREARELILL